MTHKIKTISYDDLLADLNESVKNGTAWIEIDSGLFFELADDTQVCIEHTASYEIDGKYTFYSDIRYTKLTNEQGEVIEIDADNEKMIELIESYIDKHEPYFEYEDGDSGHAEHGMSNSDFQYGFYA